MTREPIPVGAPVRWEDGRIVGRVLSSTEDRGGIRLDARITDVQVAEVYRFASQPSLAERAVALCRFRGEPPELVPLALAAGRIKEAYDRFGRDVDRVWPGRSSGGAVP